MKIYLFNRTLGPHPCQQNHYNLHEVMHISSLSHWKKIQKFEKQHQCSQKDLKVDSNILRESKDEYGRRVQYHSAKKSY